MKQSHEERCRKYKQQIENLKLDNMELKEELLKVTEKLRILKQELKGIK